MGGVVSTLGNVARAVLNNPPLMVSLAVPLVLGSIVGTSTLPAILSWYTKLDKPKWTPPAPLFGNIWSVLYGMMGYASYLVWERVGFPSKEMNVYGVQLVMNLAWQIIFFIAKKPRNAQIENLALLGAVSYTTYLFWQVNPLAGKLMVPYLAFTGFANALNYSILKRNPQADEGKPKFA